MDLYEAIEKWHYELQTIQKRARRYRGHMYREVCHLAAFLGDHDLIDTTEITGDLCIEFVQVTYENLADGTYNNYVGYLRTWLRWLADEQALGGDLVPWRKLKGRGKPKPAKEVFWTSWEEAQEYAAVGDEWHPRDGFYIRLGFWLVKRSYEILNLQVKDIDLTQRPDFPFGSVAFTDEKTGQLKTRIQIQPELRPILQEWLEYTYPEDAGRPLRQTDYLVPAIEARPALAVKGLRTPMGTVPERRCPYSSIAHALTKAGVPGSHSLRRGGAELISVVYDLDSATAALGHQDPASTHRYLRKGAGQLRFGKAIKERLDRETREAREAAKEQQEQTALEAALAELEALRAQMATGAPETAQEPAEAATVTSLEERRKARWAAS